MNYYHPGLLDWGPTGYLADLMGHRQSLGAPPFGGVLHEQ